MPAKGIKTRLEQLEKKNGQNDSIVLGIPIYDGESDDEAIAYYLKDKYMGMTVEEFRKRYKLIVFIRKFASSRDKATKFIKPISS